MANGDDDASSINERGWRQGSVLPPSLFEKLAELTGLEFSPERHCAIVASQDCDVVHPSYQVEPRVEIIRATRRDRIDGNLLFGKSSRKLQLELTSYGRVVPFELSVHERCPIDRKILQTPDPDRSTLLTPEQKRQLAGWLAKRYSRHSFPDSFVRRVKERPPADELRDLLKTWGESISGVFLLLNSEDELVSGESYVVTAWVTVPVDDYDDEEMRKNLEDQFLPPLEKVFGAFSGIEMRDVMVVSEADFTLDDLRRTKRMDFDDLSYRDDGPIVGTE